MGLSNLIVLALCASMSSAVRIISVKHSGSACPQSTSVKASGPYDNLTLTLDGFKANLPEADNCLVSIHFDQGSSGKSLVLDEAAVKGTLSLGGGTDVTFYHTAFWSESADRTAYSDVSTSSRYTSTRNVAVVQRLSAASPCVGSDGYIGILNVNFRVVGDRGSFGPTKEGPVTENLKLRWKSC